MPADPRALGALLRDHRARTGLTVDDVAARMFPDGPEVMRRRFVREAERYGRSLTIEWDDGDLEKYLDALGLDAAQRDALYAAAGLVPPDVAALAADPARWDAIRHIAARESALRENDAALEAMAARAQSKESER